MKERRTVMFGEEAWYVDGKDKTVRPHDPGFDPEKLTVKGIIQGYVIMEGDARDRPGQKQVGQSVEKFIPFPPDSPNEIPTVSIETAQIEAERDIRNSASVKRWPQS